MIQNTKISVKLTPKLRFEQALIEAGVEDPATVTQMTVSGTMTDYDFAYIREKRREELREIDMSNATVEKNRIPEGAFQDCINLETITIPNSTVEIEYGAFYGCAGLISFFIPVSVVEIDKHVFEKCTGLVSFAVHSENPVFASENGILFNKSKTKLIVFPKGRTLNKTVEHQGDSLIPDTVTEIGELAFYGCNRLTAITIPTTVTKIGNYAFNECRGLTSVDIPASVVEIGDMAFGNCSVLTSVEIPASTVKIGNSVFDKNVCVTVHPENPSYTSEDGKLTEIYRKVTLTDFAAIDFETANHHRSSVCSVGVVIVRNGQIVDKIYHLIRPAPEWYLWQFTQLHGLTAEDTENEKLFPQVWAEIEPKIVGLPLVAHNSPFDESCLRKVFSVYQMDYPEYEFYCTCKASRKTFGKALPNHQLSTVAEFCGYDLKNHHNALADAEACAVIAIRLFCEDI